MAKLDSAFPLGELAELVGAEVVGDASRVVTGLGSLDQARVVPARGYG